MTSPEGSAGAATRFISNSVNFEDVLLHRLFARQERGYFIDVGAAHPCYDNDTFALYERGWRGLNVEPNAAFFALLVQQRPEDRNICALLSDGQATSMGFHEIAGTGLSTGDPAQAAIHAAGGLPVQVRTVSVTTLAAVLQAANPPPIDILKVDVEGLEEQVLAGNDWIRFRPRLILVEATYPERPDRRPTGVRGFLAARGYRHVHFDALNDYYAEAGFDPGDGFVLPPNVFDGFDRREVVELRARVGSLQATAERMRMEALALDRARAEGERWREELAAAGRRLEQLQHQAQCAREMAAKAQAEAREQAQLLQAHRQSRSWRLTRPWRAAGRLLGRG